MAQAFVSLFYQMNIGYKTGQSLIPKEKNPQKQNQAK